ncbi:phenoloxidase subunit 2-like [Ostrinia nubilalis]|uniref:phenoloxidase subunit 2-like n=1 Tax=Ostrinia nubilalis TaxID=29057 RepID=UPI0030823F7A
MTTSVVRGLELLFDRPNEPLITPKGEEQVLFKLNEELLPPGYEDNGIVLNNRFGEEPGVQTIELKPLANPPRFRRASQLPRDEDFSLFLPRHQEMADEVIDVILAVPRNHMEELLSTCVYARGRLNPQLFHYCAAVAFLHRHDTKAVKIPNFAETFPSKFLTSTVVGEARTTTSVIPKGLNRPIITIPRDFTASNLEDEHRLAYFREDLGINLHHWHWHLIYPFRATHGNRTIVDKDRRGELFFYMHQQIIARYNNERLNNSLKRVKKFSDFREEIPEAYYPKLDSLTSSRGWPPRQANMKWQDLNRPVNGVNVRVSDMERWRNNVQEAIATGLVVLPDNSTQTLTIDMLGNMIESSILSPNPERYGSLHNNGHSFTAYIHDPNHRYLESHSVMADEATTMRDPYFYRWHAFIDDLFQKHKESPHVRKYQRSELDYPGVEVRSVSVESNTPGARSNELNTFWMTSDVDLSRGLDFSDRGNVYVRFTHLNHRSFRYVINVNNSGRARRTTVRIFLAPKFDEGGRAWLLSDQRKMFIEMDKFVHDLRPGNNQIIRQSTESSVTIPFEQTFRDLSRTGTDPGDPNNLEFNYCGCGWPQHMLLPKGTAAGAKYVLFVMLSNYEGDRVAQANVHRELTCKEASSFCGLRDRLYPDKRAMGFPFDRPSTTADHIDDFLTRNMFVQDVTIRFSDVTEQNPRNPRQQ